MSPFTRYAGLRASRTPCAPVDYMRNLTNVTLRPLRRAQGKPDPLRPR